MQQDNAGLIDATMSLTQQLTNLENKTSQALDQPYHLLTHLRLCYQAKGGAEQAQRELSCSQVLGSLADMKCSVLCIGPGTVIGTGARAAACFRTGHQNECSGLMRRLIYTC